MLLSLKLSPSLWLGGGTPELSPSLWLGGGTPELFCKNLYYINIFILPQIMQTFKYFAIIFQVKIYNFPYWLSSTGSNHSFCVSTPGTSTAKCENQEFLLAPCQCFTFAGIVTTSPGFRTLTSFPSS